MRAVRWIRFGKIGAIAALVAWLLAEPFAWTAEKYGRVVNGSHFTLGSAFGPLSYGFLGGFVCAALAYFLTRERHEHKTALRKAAFGLLLGFVLGAGCDALSDLISMQVIRQQRPSDVASLGLSLIWKLLVPTGIALAASLASFPSWTRARRMVVGGIVTGVISFFLSQTIVPFFELLDLVRVGQGAKITFIQFSFGRLADHTMMAFLLGLLMATAEETLADASVSWRADTSELIQLPLIATVNRIGTADGVEIPVAGDDSIAPVHAAIVLEEGHYLLIDTGSPAGVWLGGRRTQRQRLADGDRFQLGATTMEFRQHRLTQPDESAVPVIVHHSLTDSFDSEFALEEGINRVGAGGDCQVRFSYDKTVGDWHATIQVEGETATLSTRGETAVNDEPVAFDRQLAEGDRITFGNSAFTYRAKRQEPATQLN